MGSSHDAVEVITFSPPPAIERTLRITRALALKARLPALAGLGDRGRALWSWRSELADAYAAGAAGPGLSVVPHGPPGVLAQFELYGIGRGSGVRLSSTLIWVEPGGEWTEEEAVVAARLAAAASATRAEPDPRRLQEALALLARPIRSRLMLARGSRWAAPAPDRGAHELSLRLHQAIRDAARRRDLAALAALERALGFLAGGHTAGESLELERLAALPDGPFGREVLRLRGAGPRWDTIEPRLVGVLLFAPE